MIHPWNQAEWQRVSGIQDLHHGLMITGLSGIGKREFCLLLSQFLLCAHSVESGKTMPCGECQNCHLFTAGTHPDFHLLTSETENIETRLPLVTAYSDRYQDVAAREKKSKPGKVIAVDQVRQLIDRFSTRAHIADRKVALIMPAETMNTNAANALLKLLEEPPENAFLILMTAHPGFLPATIRSRCMMIDLPTPRTEVSLSWMSEFLPSDEAESALAFSDGGPIDAVRSYEDGFLEAQRQSVKKIVDMITTRRNPVELAADLSKTEFPRFLSWFQRFICDMIRWRTGGSLPHWAEQTGLRAGLENSVLSIERLYTLYDRINFYQRIAKDPINEQLAVEDLMFALSSATR